MKMRRPTGKEGKQSAVDTVKAEAPDFYAVSEKNPLPWYPADFLESAVDCARKKSSNNSASNSVSNNKPSEDAKEEKNIPSKNSENSRPPPGTQLLIDPSPNPQLGHIEENRGLILKLGAQHQNLQYAVSSVPTNDALTTILNQHQTLNSVPQIQPHKLLPYLQQLEMHSQQHLSYLHNMTRRQTPGNGATNLERLQLTHSALPLQNTIYNNALVGSSMQDAFYATAGQVQLQQILATNNSLATQMTVSQQQQEEFFKLLQFNRMQQQNHLFK
mmetsp:Transcript_17886/g.23858  ORF Transcript_17886/g.23858 Transcript_17886/m.23858 type:complete len:273 (+) Transcript_17886:60-878(+)